MSAVTALPRASVRLGFSVALAATLIPLGSTMLAVAVPAIAADLDLDPRVVTPWIVASYLVVCIVGQWPGGRIADAIGPQRALGAGQALCAGGAVLGLVAWSLPALVVARILMAAGGAVMVPAAMAMVREMTAPGARVRAFGWFGSLMALAGAIGPVLGGEITSTLGWRATFGLQLAPLLVSLALGWGAAWPPRERGGGERRDDGGVLAGLVRTPEFMGGGLAIAFQNTAMYATLFAMPLLLTGLRGESESAVGRVLMALTGCMVIGSFAGGHAADRIGARAVGVLASMLSVGGLVLLRDAGSIHGALDALAGLAVLGLGVGLMNGPAQGTAMSAVSAGRSGAAAGMLSTLRYTGGVLGMVLLLPLRPGAAGAAAESEHALVMTLLALAAGSAGIAALFLPGRGLEAGE